MFLESETHLYGCWELYFDLLFLSLIFVHYEWMLTGVGTNNVYVSVIRFSLIILISDEIWLVLFHCLEADCRHIDPSSVPRDVVTHSPDRSLCIPSIGKSTFRHLKKSHKCDVPLFITYLVQINLLDWCI